MKDIKKNFPFGGMVIVTGLMFVGLLMIIFLGSLPTYIVGGFFFFVGLYCWYGYICNVLIKPKEEVLYLKEKNGNRYIFLSEKGRKFNYCTKKEYEIQKYYVVLKSKDYIGEIIRLADYQIFEIIESNDSYWLNCYLPIGEFEDIFLLPIIYVIALFSISIILWQGVIDFNAIIMAIVAIYLIVYDFIYKSKKKKGKLENKEVDDEKLQKSFVAFMSAIRIFMIAIICLIILYFFCVIDEIIGKLFLLPFLLCSCCLFWQTIAMIKKNEKMVEFLGKMYIVIFLLYWFGIIFVGGYVSIINKQYSMILFLIPFILAGIYVIYKTFFKKK